MGEFIISWQICGNDRSYNEKSRRCFWTHELDDNWTIKCVCVQNKPHNPAFMEVRRKCLAGECIISGTLEIHDERKQKCLLKKKFVCLLESSCRFSRIDLQYPHDADAAKRPLKIFLVTGEITISGRIESSLDLTEMVHLTMTDLLSLKQLSEDMECLLLNESLLADASLKCGSISVPIHKSILSARSPVFEAMFSCPVKEAMGNEVIIEDIEVAVLQLMLKYIYTGSTDDLTPSLAFFLLLAANKYQIVGLKSHCSKYFMRTMPVEFIGFALLLEDLFSPDTKNFATDFICNKCSDYSALEETVGWFYLKNDNPALALEMFSKVVKSQEQKLKMCT